MGGTITTGYVCIVFTLITLLQIEMTKHLLLGVMGVSECYVSIAHIQKFLEFPEMDLDAHDSNISMAKNLTEDGSVITVSMSNEK